MSSGKAPVVAIVDYGVGNLYSVRLACETVGLAPTVTSSALDLYAADAVILPGVGAYQHAMNSLNQLGLVEPLKEIAGAGKMLVGVCLGHQLLMERSNEFGVHEGLGLIAGEVVPFVDPVENDHVLKVPQVGWNRIMQPVSEDGTKRDWTGTPLAGLEDGTYMYFVHSYFVRPDDPTVVLATTTYGQYEFCSAMAKDNVYSFQFHPERSGTDGIRVYQAIADMLKE